MISVLAGCPALKKAEHILKNGSREEYDNYVYDITSKWAGYQLKTSGAKVTVHNQEYIPKDKNVLFVSNHQGNFDIPIFLASINKNVGFIAKIELAKIPFISQWMRNINCLFMDRNDMKQSMKVIVDGIKLLKEGYSLVIFPEGTRSKGGPLGEFKAGSFKLAVKAKVPIVPVTIDGSYKIMEANNNKIKASEVNVYIHQPIYTDKLSKEEITHLHNTVKQIISKPLEKKGI